MVDKLLFTFAIIMLMNWLVALGVDKKSPDWLRNTVAITAIVCLTGIFITILISVWSS